MSIITTEDLKSFYHTKSCTDNNEIAKKIIQEFEELLKIKFTFVPADSEQEIEPELMELTQDISYFLGLRDEYVYKSPYVAEFFAILKRHNYKMKHEIKDAIVRLAELENPCHNKDVITTLLASPVIDDISFNGTDQFTIVSQMYGTFPFLLATSYFKDNPAVMNYINNAYMPRFCHLHTERLSEIFPDFTSITSLCTNYFLDYYYHSYSYNPDDAKVIDLCSKTVMDKKDYDFLGEPREISVLSNREIEDVYLQTLRETVQPSGRHKILKIALYNQLRNMPEEEKQLVKTYKQSQ